MSTWSIVGKAMPHEREILIVFLWYLHSNIYVWLGQMYPLQGLTYKCNSQIGAHLITALYSAAPSPPPPFPPRCGFKKEFPKTCTHLSRLHSFISARSPYFPACPPAVSSCTWLPCPVTMSQSVGMSGTCKWWPLRLVIGSRSYEPCTCCQWYGTSGENWQPRERWVPVIFVF